MINLKKDSKPPHGSHEACSAESHPGQTAGPSTLGCIFCISGHSRTTLSRHGALPCSSNSVNEGSGGRGSYSLTSWGGPMTHLIIRLVHLHSTSLRKPRFLTRGKEWGTARTALLLQDPGRVASLPSVPSVLAVSEISVWYGRCHLVSVSPQGSRQHKSTHGVSHPLCPNPPHVSHAVPSGFSMVS